ncbi:MAG: hypothetical protein AAGA68_08450 [Pseudomonadota bacterium]
MGLLVQRQGDEVLALEAQELLLVYEGAWVDVAAAQGIGDARSDLVVVLADEVAFEHDSWAATTRSHCRISSHELPRAMPRTVATVGTPQYFRRMSVDWKL